MSVEVYVSGPPKGNVQVKRMRRQADRDILGWEFQPQEICKVVSGISSIEDKYLQSKSDSSRYDSSRSDSSRLAETTTMVVKVNHVLHS